jgi:iron complex outermembrane receptor protein
LKEEALSTMESFGSALLLLWCAAGEVPVTQAVVKQEIVVTAARQEEPRDQASAAVTVLDREAIERLPATSLSELLSFVPGVTMMFDSGASGIPMVTSRGFFGGGEVEYVKLTINGVPVGDAESGNVDWQRFRAADIDRIEILHGPGSALYGDTALGGVIQVFTRQAAKDDERGEFRLSTGSFGARELDASYGTEISGMRVDARVGSWTTGGFRQHANTDDRDVQLMVERLGDRSRWRFDAAGDRQNRHQPGALTRGEIATDREQSNALFRFDGQNTSRSRLAATHDSFGPIPFRVTLYGAQRDDDNLRTLLLTPGFGTSAFRKLTTRTGGGTFEASRESARGTVRAGADVERATLSGRYASVGTSGETGGTIASERGARDRIGLFVTGGLAIGERFRLTGGVRRDEIRDDLTGTTTGGLARRQTLSAWSPRVGLNVHLGPPATPLSLFVQVSSAFKAPTLDQLFDPRPYPDGSGGTFTISNPQLRPQRARNVEAGLSRVSPGSSWSVVAYRMLVKDEIDFDPQTFTYDNIGSSLHRGVESSVEIAKTARVSPQLTYAWTSVAETAAPDRQLKNIPEHAAQLLLRARISVTTRADLVYRWRSGLTLDDTGTFVTPAISRVDLRLAHDLRRLRLQADLLNALNAHYNELGYVLLDFEGRPTPLEFPAPGRALRFNVTWTFSRRGNG